MPSRWSHDLDVIERALHHGSVRAAWSMCTGLRGAAAAAHRSGCCIPLLVVSSTRSQKPKGTTGPMDCDCEVSSIVCAQIVIIMKQGIRSIQHGRCLPCCREVASISRSKNAGKKIFRKKKTAETHRAAGRARFPLNSGGTNFSKRTRPPRAGKARAAPRLCGRPHVNRARSSVAPCAPSPVGRKGSPRTLGG